MTRRLRLLTRLFPSLFVALPVAAQSPPAATLVIAVAGDPASPVPTLWRNDQGNRELSDLLFLRLADLGPGLNTIDEKSFVPRLARRWQRRDALTLVFELDPRARWHDGTPVTAHDVVFTLERAKNPALSPQTSTLLRRIRSVTAETEGRLVVRFSQSYPEQLYDATYHVPPLPSHLLESIAAESLATSPFVSRPIGDGPYRFVRRQPGQLVELAANTEFFLGAPRVTRVMFLTAKDPEARANLLLTGEVDAIDNIYALPNWARLEALPAFQYYPVPGPTLVYANFNQRDPADSASPHPILADPAVRRALLLALDRAEMIRAVYGPLARVPDGPLSAILNRSVDGPAPIRRDTAGARRLLASHGWLDHDGDGVLDKAGKPLAFSIMIPGVVASRVALGTQMQEAWRRLGIGAALDVVERNIYVERRNAGRFDLELSASSQDPTPSGLVQSWTCAGIGGSNVSHYCDPRVDSLLARAAGATPNQARQLYRDAVRQIAEDVPAIFLAAPVFGTPVHRRFTNVVVRPESSWSLVWQWALRPGLQIDRDRP